MSALTILSGAAVSQDLPLSISGARRLRRIEIYAPAALTNAVTVQVAPSASGTFVTLRDTAGADVTVVAGKCTSISHLGAAVLKLVSAGNEGADRAFQVVSAVMN